ncbi:polyphosphate--glucose phosphotransferase [Puniceicoccus vermicola]|uniref:ROK family protein n=1 Tax=Puniceicoccus vermicola TaxID=388746 RepID=A0A7X1E307_9BACT|nr:ROK family protein [Puniceicoccus vermicola]MBC2600453.1 ROK family protein [Puniceicoccus vermicola]
MKAIGIDIGGSRIKAAVVDTDDGSLITKRQRIDTPRPATPSAIIDACGEVLETFGDISPVGVGFPGVVRDGKVLTAQNLHQDWIGFSLEEALSERLQRPVRGLNDADSAGVAEVRFGAGQGVDGSVILLTIGTGLGSALFTDGKLVQNTEMGRMFFGRKREAEDYVSGTAKERDGLSNEEWAKRFEEYLKHLEDLYWPRMIIVGGGGAKKFPEVKDLIKTRCELRHATAKNKAGIIGAAVWAADQS